MSELKGELNSDDLQVLMEAMDHWERGEQHTLQMCKILRAIPEGEELDRLLEETVPESIRDSLRAQVISEKRQVDSKEKEAKANLEIRREKSILLRAKLILMKQSAAVDQLFSGSSEDSEAS